MEVRYLDIYEEDPLDEVQLAAWFATNSMLHADVRCWSRGIEDCSNNDLIPIGAVGHAKPSAPELEQIAKQLHRQFIAARSADRRLAAVPSGPTTAVNPPCT
jgi:hypothetical protein